MSTGYASIYLENEKCVGCTKCMQRCPTEAIRIRGGGDLKYAVKPDAQQSFQNGSAGPHAGKLPIERLRRERDRVFVFSKHVGERIHPRLHRMVRADADTLAAIDAAFA